MKKAVYKHYIVLSHFNFLKYIYAKKKTLQGDSMKILPFWMVVLCEVLIFDSMINMFYFAIRKKSYSAETT